MKNIFFLFIIIATYIFVSSNEIVNASQYFNEGKALFDKKKFDESKIFFERDIVFNPKSENSYLYLAKIFDELKSDQEQEINLNSVLLLNPKNDEAIYLLTLLKIKQSDYENANMLIKKFNLLCENFCSKKNELNKKFEKIKP